MKPLGHDYPPHTHFTSSYMAFYIIIHDIAVSKATSKWLKSHLPNISLTTASCCSALGELRDGLRTTGLGLLSPPCGSRDTAAIHTRIWIVNGHTFFFDGAL